MKINIIILALFCCLGMGVQKSHAQSAKKTIAGVIIDSKSKEPLVGASVYIKEIGRGAASDGKGSFSISGLDDGRYVVNISYIGYKTLREEINVSTVKTGNHTFRLEPDESALEEVTIVAKNKARVLREQAMPVSTINMQQLQGTVSNVQDVLSKTVGVTIRSSGGVGSASRVSVRGLEGKRIGFFIDGTPMNDNSDFIDINDIPVEMIDRIEIYKGVVPAKFGGSAVGGAINIVIRKYPPKYLDANYTLGSFNTHKASLVSKLNDANKGYEFGLAAFYNYSDNNYTMKSPFDDDLTIKRDHDQFKKLTLGGSFKARNWYFDLVEFEPYYSHAYKQIQGIEYNIQRAYSTSDAVNISNKMEKKNFLIAGLDFDWALLYAYTDYQVIDTASYRTHWDGTHYPALSEFGGEVGQYPSLSQTKKHTVTHKLNLNYLINNRHSINLNSVINYGHSTPKDEIKDKVLGYKTNFKSNMTSWTLGLNYDYRSDRDKFLNSTNMKYYYYTMKTKLAGLLTNSIQEVDMKKQDVGISNASRYRFTPDFMGKFSVGYDVRLPAEDELLGDGYTIAPAGNLEPERNLSFNLGFFYDRTGKSKHNLQIELNAFYMQLSNMIRFTGGSMQSQYQNFGEMRSMGIEAEVKADILSWIYGYVNATYQDLRDTRRYEQNTYVPNPTKGSRMPNIPYLMGNAGLEFHKENLWGGKGQNTRLFTDGTFVEEYLYDFEQSIYQQRRIPRTLSFNAGVEQSFGDGRYFITARVFNVNSAQMMSEFNRPLPGRNFDVKLRYVFK